MLAICSDMQQHFPGFYFQLGVKNYETHIWLIPKIYSNILHFLHGNPKIT